jgi:3-oxoadipate enol-lactonase
MSDDRPPAGARIAERESAGAGVTSLVRVRDCRLACTLTGSGMPLLLMHGAEGNHGMFDALVPYLAPHFQVIAYDQRDCGDTVNPEAPSTLTDLADDAAGLLAALGHPRAVVYGSSFGGRVAQALAHRHPHVISYLVLGNTWALPDDLAQLNRENVAAIHALRARLPHTAAELAAYMFPDAFLAERPDLLGIFGKVQPQTPRSQRRQSLVAERVPSDPADLRVPTLVITGDQDRVVPPAVTLALARAIPHAQAVCLSGVGHAAALQVPAVVAAHLRAFCDPAAATQIATSTATMPAVASSPEEHHG